jgi:hypothetical protein
MGPLAKPATKAMKGLFAKSLISVAEAVSTILTPELAAISLRLSEVTEKKILDGYIKRYRSKPLNLEATEPPGGGRSVFSMQLLSICNSTLAEEKNPCLPSE